jgi:hypothetical protein
MEKGMRFMEAKNLNNEWSNLNLKNLLLNIKVFTVSRRGPQPQQLQQQQQQQQCMECSISTEGAVVASVFRPVVLYMIFFKFIKEPYKFLTTKKNGYSRVSYASLRT